MQSHREVYLCASLGPALHLAANYCPTSTSDNATWPSTRAGQSGLGTCVNGFEGNPIRFCDENGVWQGVTNPCMRTVPACTGETFQNSVWQQTTPGATTTGTCIYGFSPAPAGPPTRTCIRNDEAMTSAWSAVQNPCVFSMCARGQKVHVGFAIC